MLWSQQHNTGMADGGDVTTQQQGSNTSCGMCMMLLGLVCACRYIIGLPLWQKNAIDMSQQIIAAAQEHLGDALLGFELGNEVGDGPLLRLSSTQLWISQTSCLIYWQLLQSNSVLLHTSSGLAHLKIWVTKHAQEHQGCGSSCIPLGSDVYLQLCSVACTLS